MLTTRKKIRQHNEKPILVFDFLAFINLLTTDHKETLVGGRFWKLKQTFDGLLRKFSQIAELYFFEDGIVDDVKLKSWIPRHSTK